MNIDKIDADTSNRFFTNGSVERHRLFTKNQDKLEVYDLAKKEKLAVYAFPEQDYLILSKQFEGVREQSNLFLIIWRQRMQWLCMQHGEVEFT